MRLNSLKDIYKVFIEKAKKTSFAYWVRYIRLVIYRNLNKLSLEKNNSISTDDIKITIMSDCNNATFFGYHDKTPFSQDGKKILAMSVTSKDTSAVSECTTMKLGYFEKTSENGFNSSFIPFATTNSWCWQQGCMIQWYPKQPSSQVIFNDIVSGGYGAIIYDLESDQKVMEYNDPIYSIDPNGQTAVTLDFYRLGRLRPGYGYTIIPSPTYEYNAPDDDGLFTVNLQNRSKELLVSLHDLAENDKDHLNKHYINHATFSPDGNSIVFFHLWECGHGRNLRVCIADKNSSGFRVLEDERIISHYCWKDNDNILATGRDKQGNWYYSIYSININKRDDLDLDLFCDGHPMFHPINKNLIVTDTYPDRLREQKLYIGDLFNNKVHKLYSFFSPLKYRGQIRCDLHPRWDREGKYIVVDTTHQGIRKMALLEMGCIII